MATTNQFQVVLKSKLGVVTTLYVNASNSKEAINNAINTLAPCNPTSLTAVSVNSFNSCSTGNIQNTLYGRNNLVNNGIATGGPGGQTNINNY